MSNPEVEFRVRFWVKVSASATSSAGSSTTPRARACVTVRGTTSLG
jgi:hypothetical protein